MKQKYSKLFKKMNEMIRFVRYHSVIRRNSAMRSIIVLVLILVLSNPMGAQGSHGNTFNLGIGLGYYGYVRGSVAVLQANYELEVSPNFTLAPFIGFYSYRSDYYWDNRGYYGFRETVIPLGVKGFYYFDDLLEADEKWDFYLAASLGAAIRRTRWDEGYYGDKKAYRRHYRGASPIYLDLHAGAEYHFNDRIGMFLDLSTGVSTLGVSIK
jgi:hypothetical protein